MKHNASYEVTKELQDSSIRQYFWKVLLRPRIGGLLAVLAVLIAFIVLDAPLKPWSVAFFSALLFLLIIMWVKTYVQALGQARTGLRLMEHPRVEVTLDEEQVEYASSTGTRRHNWGKIERIEETKDFVILMNGKLPLLILPKACFSTDALAFMNGKVRSKSAAHS